MHYLLLSILSSVLIAVVIRVNEARNLNRFGVMFFNYLTAFATGWLLQSGSVFGGDSISMIPLSIFTGVVFVTAFTVYMLAVRKMGLAVPVTVTRLSVVLPVLGSILIFSETINWYQFFGLGLALVAIYLISWQKSSGSSPDKKIYALLPLALFLLMGAGDFSLKVFQEKFSESLMLNFMIYVFFVSTLYTFLIVVISRIKLTGSLLAGGVLLGIPNFFSAYFILKVLQVFPGAIAFPLNNIGIILLSTLVGLVVWKEKINVRTTLAIILAVSAVILLNF
ncbi:MAG: hypothetical protein Kow0042_11240 [Calditrichia bacterium]